MIRVNNLTKKYTDTVVLDIPGLTINKGESFGLVGNNGAGKTTFFRLILDLIRSTSGEIYSNENNVAETEDWKNYTGSYLDKSFIIDFLTPEEYFEFIGNIYGLSKDDIQNFLVDFEEFFNGEILGKNKFIRDLSSGNQQKVGIASALMANPEVLVLDEPFNSLDPTTQIRLSKLLNKLRKDKNVTMLISSHDLNYISEVCDRIVVLEEGKVVHDIISSENTLKELKSYFAV